MTASERKVERIIAGQPTSDGAGVRLLRAIGGAELPEFDPFLLLDEILSDDADDYIAGFPDHPHRGFETVTYMLVGRMRHGDNQGNSGLLEAGSVQWMTAGRGIVHSEMPEQQDGLMWGFQLWVNLPARAKMTAPRYQDIPPAAIPEVASPDKPRVCVIAGTYEGVDGPVGDVDAEPLYLDVTLAAGESLHLPVPREHNAFLYCFEGDITIGATAVGTRRLAVLSLGEQLSVTGGAEGGRFLVVAGRPFGEPVARYGPFVMNTREEIIQAIDDLRSGQF